MCSTQALWHFQTVIWKTKGCSWSTSDCLGSRITSHLKLSAFSCSLKGVVHSLVLFLAAFSEMVIETVYLLHSYLLFRVLQDLRCWFSFLLEGFEHTLTMSQPGVLTISLWFGHGDVILDNFGDCCTTIQLRVQLSLDKYKAGRRRWQLNSSVGHFQNAPDLSSQCLLGHQW